jgi:N-methylhydantoinase A
MSGRSVGVDVGGTFTDLVSIGDDGLVEARKVLSTPADQSGGVMAALDALGAPPATIGRVVHGTTVATNALLERTGARVVLCATEGATDLLALRRQERASLYDLTRDHPPPLVPAERCVAVPERIAPEGVVRPLAPSDAAAVARRVAAQEPEIVAVTLLHAYLDARHEHALAAALRAAAPELDVVLSSDVLPEIREYERAATTVAEAYLRPGVARYLARLAARLDECGYPPLAVMTSAGGMRAAAEAGRSAAALALSGPAGGVVGAAFVARLAGVRDALTIDIGGTSADAGVILDGEPLVESGGDVAGVPIALPRVLVETVSAGGGSLAWIDDGGALRVGPRSAGAVPGPAAFGRGGSEATVTDAHVVLGNLGRAGGAADGAAGEGAGHLGSAHARMSGGVVLRPELAHAAVERVARRLGAPPERVAAAMVRSADAAMARALRRVSIERGVDPRRCTLVAFGGGGPLHACALAEQLGMRRVLVPPLAGVLSALGLAIAAERREAMASVMRHATALTPADTRALCDVLAQRAGAGPERRWWARARYVGQGHELEVALSPGDDGAALATRFAALHAARYGFTLDRPVEVIGARHAASGAAREPRLVRHGAPAWTADDYVDTGAPLDVAVRGRAVIALPDASLLVAPGWTARALPIGGWMLERDA